jgi:hypothetical protein
MGRVMALIRFAPLRAIRSPDPRLEVHLGDTRPGRLAGRAPTPPTLHSAQSIRWRDGRCIWWRNLSTHADALETIELEA